MVLPSTLCRGGGVLCTIVRDAASGGSGPGWALTPQVGAGLEPYSSVVDFCPCYSAQLHARVHLSCIPERRHMSVPTRGHKCAFFLSSAFPFVPSVCPTFLVE